MQFPLLETLPPAQRLSPPAARGGAGGFEALLGQAPVTDLREAVEKLAEGRAGEASELTAELAQGRVTRGVAKGDGSTDPDETGVAESSAASDAPQTMPIDDAMPMPVTGPQVARTPRGSLEVTPRTAEAPEETASPVTATDNRTEAPISAQPELSPQEEIPQAQVAEAPDVRVREIVAAEAGTDDVRQVRAVEGRTRDASAMAAPVAMMQRAVPSASQPGPGQIPVAVPALQSAASSAPSAPSAPSTPTAEGVALPSQVSAEIRQAGAPNPNAPQVDVTQVTARQAPMSQATANDSSAPQVTAAPPTAPALAFAEILPTGAPPRIDAALAETRLPEPSAPKSLLVQNVAERIVTLAPGPGLTTLRLRPHGLGLIEISIEQATDGRLDVQMRVQNPLVLDAMLGERAALSQLFAGPQGSPGGALALSLFQPGGDTPGGQRREPEGQTPTRQNDRAETDLVEPESEPTASLVSSDHLNILT